MKNLSTILPFYDTLAEQYRFREDCDVEPCLVSLDTALIPFCIRRTHNAGTDPSSINVFITPVKNPGATINTPPPPWPPGHPIEIHGEDFGIVIIPGTTYDIISYAGVALGGTIPHANGGYYLEIVDLEVDKHWFSETFIVTNVVLDYLKLEFYNTTELSHIPANFHQIIYLNSTLKTPEYLREDTGDKRDGLTVKEKQVMMKSYALRSLLATEYLVDALMLVPLMDYVSITVQSGEVLTFDEVRIKDPEWSAEALGSRAKVELQLIRDVVIKKLSFKETGYGNGGDMTAIVKGGIAETTFHSGEYEVPIVFDEDMPVDTYGLSVFAMSLDTIPNVQNCYIRNITTHGFNAVTPVPCNVRWTAIYNPTS